MLTMRKFMLINYKKYMLLLIMSLLFFINCKDIQKDDLKRILGSVVLLPNEFKQKNPFVKSCTLCNTFITDKDNTVIWLGSPIESSASLEKYRKMMSLLVNQ